MIARAGVLVVAMFATAGCGEEALSDADDHEVRGIVGEISYYCPHSAAPERPAPPHIVHGVNRLIAIHRKDPDAIFMDSHAEERQPMSDLMEVMEGQVRWCDPRLADRIRREL